MYNAEKLLKDLQAIEYEIGRHSGLWELSNNREQIATDTYEFMKEKAKEYNIPVKECLKDYFFESDYQDHLKFGIEYAYDEIAFELKEKIEKKIKKELLK